MRSGAQKRDHLELVRQSVTTAATLAHERTLLVDSGLFQLVPTGQIKRGSTLAVHGVGATSFALALAAQPVRDGSFLAIIAPPSFSLGACLDFAIPLRRVVQFVLPAGNLWPQSVAAVVEGFDVVVLADGCQVKASQARLLTARTRERGSVLVCVGGSARSWPDATDLQFNVSDPGWSGLGQGYGHLQARQVAVRATGRRYHGGTRPHQILLPAVEGGVKEAPMVSPVATEQDVDRFAGADIDAFLDVVDAADAEMGHADGVGGVTSSATDGIADGDLDAIA